MSYDIYLRAPQDTRPTSDDDDYPELPHPTYNLTPIFDRALTGEPLPSPEVPEIAVVLGGKATARPRGLRLINGRKARDTVVALRKAVGHLNDPAQEAAFRALEPSNRWGTLEGARKVMAALLEAAEEYPEHVWEIH